MKAIFESNSIEEIVCKPIERAPKYPMDEDTTKLLVNLILGEGIKIPDANKPFLFQLIEKRIEGCFTFKITDQRLILFLCLIAKTPGNAVMYLWYLQYWSNKRGVSEIDLNLFCEIFPVGFPSEESLSKIWASQKVKGQPDNLVDHSEAGKSMFQPQTV